MKNEMGCVWRRESFVEIKALFTGRLAFYRVKEIQDEIVKLGIAGWLQLILVHCHLILASGK